DDRFDLIRAEHREHDGIATPREIGNGRSRAAAKLGELGVLGRIDVEPNDLEAGVEQAMRERLTQQADADEADWLTVAHEPHPSPTPPNRHHLFQDQAAHLITCCCRRSHRTVALVQSTKWRDAEIARGRLETLAQRLGHRYPVLGAVLPLE